MNTILQKRIEEAGEEFANSTTSNLLNVFETTGRFEGFEQGAAFALRQQWIPVEEALPEDKTKVFVIVKTPVGIVHRVDYHINDYWYMSRYSPEEIVTHWMFIPQLEGEK